MLDVIAEVLLPVFFVAGLGAVAQRRLDLPVDAFNRLVFSVLTPCLVFTSLARVDFTAAEPGRIALFATAAMVVMIAIGLLITQLGRMDRVFGRAFLLAITFPNLGNYGVSVAFLAFGQDGLTVAIILFSVQTVFAQIVASVIAASSTDRLRDALLGMARLPMTWAVVAALILDLTGTAVPEVAMTAIGIPAGAAIPVMLLVLGMNFRGLPARDHQSALALAVGLRLLGGLAIGFLLTGLLDFTDATRSVLIVGAGMPTAVFTTIISRRYGTYPQFVSDAVVVSTLASVFTIGAALALLAPTR